MSFHLKSITCVEDKIKQISAELHVWDGPDQIDQIILNISVRWNINAHLVSGFYFVIDELIEYARLDL